MYLSLQYRDKALEGQIISGVADLRRRYLGRQRETGGVVEPLQEEPPAEELVAL